jgi:hypothetical protein
MVRSLTIAVKIFLGVHAGGPPSGRALPTESPSRIRRRSPACEFSILAGLLRWREYFPRSSIVITSEQSSHSCLRRRTFVKEGRFVVNQHS